MRTATLGLAAAAGTGHVLYPAVLALASARKPDPTPPRPPSRLPYLTVLIAAYREATVIAKKIRDSEANSYPGSLQILVVADDPETAQAARTAGADVIEAPERLGKAEAINRGVAEARGDVIVLTDANTALSPGSLEALARWFDDPSVDAVAGEKVVAADGEGAYWRFESQLKRWEARTGATIAVVGELVAFRRSTYKPLPPDVIVDDLWLALDVIEGVGRIVYESAARAIEEGAPDWRDDWQRRTRILAGLLDVVWRRRELLAPRRGAVAAQLWGHKLIRSTLGPLAHVALVVLAIGRAPRSRVAAATAAFNVAGVAAMVRTMRRRPQGRLEEALGQAFFLQAVAIGGVFRYLRGDRPALWPKPARPPASPRD